MLETTSTPINGKEAKELINIQLKKILDSTPGLDLATSYHRIIIKLNFELSAYPSDYASRFPKREVEFNIDSLSTSKGENESELQRIQRLETSRQELLGYLAKLTDELEQANPKYSAEIELSATNSPDDLRIDEGLPIPVTKRIGGRTVEEYMGVERKGNNISFRDLNK